MPKKKRRNRKPKPKPNKTILDFPPDILSEILCQMDRSDIQNLSLVSRSFRSFFDRYIHTLKFLTPPPSKYYASFSKLFSRFDSITRLVITCRRRTTDFLTALANSSSCFNIQVLEIHGSLQLPMQPDVQAALYERFQMVEKLKLICVECLNFQYSEFIQHFPSLQDVELEGCVDEGDDEIQKLVVSSPNLQRLNLRCFRNMTDQSLEALSSKCVNLEAISIDECKNITMPAFCALVHKHRTTLKSLYIPEFYVRKKKRPIPEFFCMRMKEDDILALAKTISSCDGLNHLSLAGSDLMRDVYLSVIADSRFPLTTLKFISLSHLTGCTMTGFSVMLRAFPWLTTLHMFIPCSESCVQDMEMSRLVKSLPFLEDVYLSLWSPAYATLFSLIHSCTILVRITIESMEEAQNTHFDVPHGIRQNHSIQDIRVLPPPLDSSSMKTVIESCCPCLKTLIC